MPTEKSKNIWIFNHYATGMFVNKGGRHYCFAKHLINKGYSPVIFCANTYHNSNKCIDIWKKKYKVNMIEACPFVFVKTSKYKGNGFSRIINMFGFYKNLLSTAISYAKEAGNPDVIIASSVHPLTLLAGIQMARKYKIPCICEIRDLWPESFVAYGIVKKNNPLLILLYAFEEWIYKRADRLIFTMEGGIDYIIERGWDKDFNNGSIKINKAYHINNGIDLEDFDYNKKHYQIENKDLFNPDIFKVVYTGSIRKVNQVGMILDTAKKLRENGETDILFLIWGNGDAVEELCERVQKENLNNVCFKGHVDKKFIPYITSHSNLNIIFGGNNSLYRFGISLNKMFDYFAAGKPLLCTYTAGYSLIKKYNAGVELQDSSPENIAKSIVYFKNMQIDQYNKICKNSRNVAIDYDFKKLTESLINIIESCTTTT